MGVCINCGAKAVKSTVCEMQDEKTEIRGRRKAFTRAFVDTPDAVYKHKNRKAPENRGFEGAEGKKIRKFLEKDLKNPLIFQEK